MYTGVTGLRKTYVLPVNGPPGHILHDDRYGGTRAPLKHRKEIHTDAAKPYKHTQRMGLIMELSQCLIIGSNLFLYHIKYNATHDQISKCRHLNKKNKIN